MRLRALGLICLVVAALSGVALFSSFGQGVGGWLDGLFLVAAGLTILVSIRLLIQAASRDIGRTLDADTAGVGDVQNPDRSGHRRD